MPECAAVIATYNPEDNLVETVRMLSAEGVGVIIVDDNSTDINASRIFEECKRARADVITKDVNRGIGDSLNRGIDWARERGYTYLLTLDQDSLFGHDYVRKSIDYFEFLVKGNFAVGLVTASTVNGRTREPRFETRDVSIGIDVMQSGSLYSMEVIGHLGGFKSSFMMDCVDTEYCLRLRKAGYEIFWNPGTEFQHELGNTKKVQIFGLPLKFGKRTIATSHHSDSRRYYMTRNRIALVRAYGMTDYIWLKKAAFAYFEETVKAILFETNRCRRIRTIIEGTVDGLIGRTGSRDAKYIGGK